MAATEKPLDAMLKAELLEYARALTEQAGDATAEAARLYVEAEEAVVQARDRTHADACYARLKALVMEQ